MNLSSLYNKIDLPFGDRMPLEKNIILVVPNRDTDISGLLARAKLDRYEVGVTWPKKGVDLLQEICAARPKLVVQVDKQFSRKWPLVSSDGDWDKKLDDKVKAVMTDTFVGLHHHDEFSIKDGLGTVSQMVQLLKAQRRSFCCVTNHGSVGGWVKQYNACREAGIKPIFGMEAYVNNGYRGEANVDPEIKRANRSSNHLIVLAKNKTGFDNIIRIHNDAQLNGFYYDPRASWESMSKWGEGVIGTSACFKGELSEAVMADDFDKAKETWDFYTGAFDEFYVELQILEFEAQRELNRRLIKFARQVDAPLILACDSHYLVPEHAESHDLLMMIRQGKTVLDKLEKEEDVWNFDVRNLYYRNSDQMEEVFTNGFTEKGGQFHEPYKDEVFDEVAFREAMDNTRKVALDVEDIRLDDEVKLPRLYPDSKKILRDKINKGFKERGFNKLKPELKEVYKDRLLHEYEIVNRLGWADYFLVMENIVEWTLKEFGEWAIGYGRGSAAGSLVSYCLKLTDIDPIEHDLLFERFLDESRPDPPDIDTDFDPRVRDKVKDYIVEFFGEKNTCSIGTYQTYKTKAVILDAARALGLDVHEANAVTKKMDSLQSFDTADGSEKLDEMSFDDLAEHYPELLEYFSKFPEVLFHAEVLRNQVKNMGKHAGGVIISDLDLTGRIPVLRVDGKNNEGGTIISAWAESGNAAELSSVGLVKFDILGLGNLPVISDCVEFIEKTRGIRIARSDIPLDDREAILMGSKRDLVGIFQFESPVTRPIVDAVQMESLNDVSAITSLLRPGPKDMGMDMEYAERKHGKTYDMPGFMREALKETYGVITYQEQAMKISKVLAGFTGPEANKLRKAIGKKIKELMAEMKQKFVKGSKKRVDAGEITEEEVLEVWNLLESFAGYGFNKSVDGDTEVVTLDGIRRIEDVRAGQRVWCFDGVKFVETDVVALHDHGILPAFEIIFDDGSKEICSINHKFLTEHGQIPIRDIIEFDYGVCADAKSKRGLGLSDLSGCIPNEKKSSGSPEGFGAQQPRETEEMVLRGLQSGDKRCPQLGESSGKMPKGNKDCKREQGEGECGAGKAASWGASVRSGEAKVEGYVEGSGKFSSGKEGPVCHYDQLEQEQKRQEGGIRDCSGNICSSRNTTAESRSISEMAEGESRTVCGDYQEGTVCGEAIQGGGLAEEECISGPWVQKECSGALRGDTQTVRLRKEGLLDRGGRVLALRNGLYEQEVLVGVGSREGHNSQQGSGETRNSIGSPRGGLLERVRERNTKGRLEDGLGKYSGESGSGCISIRRVLHARFVGFRQMYDLEVSHPSHNFRLASGLITSNSHAVSYSAITTAELWLKFNYPVEYLTSLINNTPQGKKKHGVVMFSHYINYARKRGFTVMPPDINKSEEKFTIENRMDIRFSLGHVKNVASSAKHIEALGPYESIEDFYEKCVYKTPTKGGKNPGRMRTVRPNKKQVLSLIMAGAFDSMIQEGEDVGIASIRNKLVSLYWKAKKEKSEMPEYTEKEWQEKERETIGLCLSEEPILKTYKERIKEEDWCKIEDSESKGRVLMFGRISFIKPHTSKKGNEMYIVGLTDGIDYMEFFVFRQAMEMFRDNYKTGYVAAIPMKKFEDSDTRFFDDGKRGVVVEK